jgi:hypothetical protein
MLGQTLSRILFLLGVGYLAANLRIFVEGLQFLRRRSTALLTWPGQRPPYYGLLLAIGVVLGVLLFYKLVFQHRPPTQVFGEAMMFLYYSYAVPFSRRIGRGFYEDGIWTESGFVPYASVGGITWREDGEPTLVVISRLRNLARRLVVPGRHYAAARRLLRDKIAAHDIHFSGTGLNLETHDEREDV